MNGKIIDVCCTSQQACVVAENMPPLFIWVENGEYKAVLGKVTTEEINIVEEPL